MFSMLVYLLVFLAGLIIGDLIRFGQERYRLRQVTRAMLRVGGSADAACRQWSADPEYWCDRPGCPRCWGDHP